MTPASAAAPARLPLARWRLTGIGLLRIAFGLVWAIDAWFKWQPDFLNHFTDYLTALGRISRLGRRLDRLLDQPREDRSGDLRAAGRGRRDRHRHRAIVGAFTNLATVGGAALALVIWSTAEGFGGPYQAGSTDVGSAIIYAIVLAALFLSQAGLYLGLDRRVTPVLGRFGLLASGPLPR